MFTAYIIVYVNKSKHTYVTNEIAKKGNIYGITVKIFYLYSQRISRLIKLLKKNI